MPGRFASAARRLEDPKNLNNDTGKGFAIEVARALTAAFAVPEIEIVEIRTDKANVASTMIPDRFG